MNDVRHYWKVSEKEGVHENLAKNRHNVGYKEGYKKWLKRNLQGIAEQAPPIGLKSKIPTIPRGV